MVEFSRGCGALIGGALCLLASVAAQAQSPTPKLTRQGPPPQVSAPPAPAPLTDPYAVTLRPEQITLLRRALAEAPSHGFELGAFSPDPAMALLESGDETSRRAGQHQLVAQVLAYAKAVRMGRLAAASFMSDWGLRPTDYDPNAEFVAAVTQDRLEPWLNGLPPPYTGYATLRRGLATYRDISAKGGWAPLPAGPDLKQGAVSAEVVALKARLAAEDPTVVVDNGKVFDQTLAQALMRAQKRFGLNPNGVLNTKTLAALNTPVALRLDQIVANMERWRWLPQALPADRIQVNIAAAVLSMFRQDTPVLTMRAVTGRPGDETPMLSSNIHSIVLNPPWNVPSSIAAKELWPKERANPGYLARNDFIVIPNDDGGSRLQQKAGPKAALGLIKFDFANSYGVYLHDTPSRSRFLSFSRLASHGCVRLEKPLELARLVMEGDPTWTPQAIDEAIASGKTVRAQAPQPIAVFLLYWTAYVTPDGQVNFRDDPYGWDRELVQRIAASPRGSA